MDRFLLGFDVVELTRGVAARAVENRRSRRMRLPDPGVRMPYTA